MLFTADIIIPASTTAAAPKVVKFPIAKGIISKFIVRPRPGHSSLAHLVIKYHEHQIAPSMMSTDISGDTWPIDWEDYYECYTDPFELKLEGWNDDDTYPHTFTVSVAVLPRKAILSLAIADALSGLIGRISPRRIFTSGGGV